MIKLKKLKKIGKKKYLNKKYLLILPILLFNIIFFIGSLFNGISLSFGNEFYKNGWFLDKNFIFFNEEILNSFTFTLKISLITTLISLFISLIGIYFIYNKPKVKSFFTKILYLPLLTPYILIAFFMLYTFSTSGFINRLLYRFNIIRNLKTAPIYINDLNGLGIILGYLWKTIPFVFIILLNSLETFNNRLLKISESLGANERSSFKYIIWPHLKKHLFYSGIIVFSFVFSSVEIPLILGPTRPEMLSQWVYKNFQHGQIVNRSNSFSIATIILTINILVTVYISNKIKKEQI